MYIFEYICKTLEKNPSAHIKKCIFFNSLPYLSKMHTAPFFSDIINGNTLWKKT